MTAADELIYVQGLMRCCIQTLRERTAPALNGQIQRCRFCLSELTFRTELFPVQPGYRGGWHYPGVVSSPGSVLTADEIADIVEAHRRSTMRALVNERAPRPFPRHARVAEAVVLRPMSHVD